MNNDATGKLYPEKPEWVNVAGSGGIASVTFKLLCVGFADIYLLGHISP